MVISAGLCLGFLRTLLYGLTSLHAAYNVQNLFVDYKQMSYEV